MASNKQLASNSRPNSKIRRADISEITTLTALVQRSISYWGYDEDYQAWLSFFATVKDEDIVSGWVFVFEVDGRIIGFYSLSTRLDFPSQVVIDKPSLNLVDLYLEPNFIGHGYGKQLWQHAIAIVRRLGYPQIFIRAAPNAGEFYKHMGAKWAGTEAHQESSQIRNNPFHVALIYRYNITHL